MRMPALHSPLTPDNTLFVFVSFEGPDAYAQAGGWESG